MQISSETSRATSISTAGYQRWERAPDTAPEAPHSSPLPFEGVMVTELSRRFGDRRAFMYRTTRDGLVQVVRARYWHIFAYLFLSTIVWLTLVSACIIGVFAVLDAKRNATSFVLITFLVCVAVTPLLHSVERALCSGWVLGLRSRPQATVPAEAPASHDAAQHLSRDKAA